MKYTQLTAEQKLDALALKYYQHFKWEPKNGDYYTSSRFDYQLYQIVDEDEKYFYTVYCHQENCSHEKWKKDTFLQDFGLMRVYVPNHILESIYEVKPPVNAIQCSNCMEYYTDWNKHKCETF